MDQQASVAPAAGLSASARKWLIGMAVTLTVVIVAYFLFKPAPTPLDHAIELIKANRHAAALPLLEAIARKQPDNDEVFPWLAQCYLRTDRLAEGRTALDTALKLKLPCSLTGPVVLSYAIYYENKNDFPEAEKLFASAQSSCPDQDLAAGRSSLYVRWSDAQANDGQTEQALTYLKLAYQLMPDNDPARPTLPHKIGDYYRQLAAMAETEEKDDQRAVQLLQESLHWSDEPATRMALGNIYTRNNNITDAIENYKTVCQQDVNNLEAHHHLVDLYLQADNIQGAQEALLELTEKERSVENFDLLASLSLRIGNYASAVRALEDAIVLRPNDVTLLTKLHDALATWSAELLHRGKLEEATSVKGHAERVADVLKQLALADEKKLSEKGETSNLPGNPPVSLVSSRIWLAKGSFTPEGEVRFKNISGEPVTDLALTIIFWDNTSRRQNGSVTVTAASETHPLQSGAIQSVYFSCPNIVRAEHQLAVILLWKGRLLKELPVVKER